MNVAAPLAPVVVSVIGDWKSVPAVATEITPLLSLFIIPFRLLVFIEILGVVVLVATVPLKPLAVATLTLVTVPEFDVIVELSVPVVALKFKPVPIVTLLIAPDEASLRNIPAMPLVFILMLGVVVLVATVPLKPLAVATLTLDTVPA